MLDDNPGRQPVVNDMEWTDKYGRTTVLVDRRLLEQAQARIAELETERDCWRTDALGYRDILEQVKRTIKVDGVRYAELPKLVHEYGGDCNRAGQSLTARHKQDIIDRYKAESEQRWTELLAALAECDHWRAEAEKARTPDAGNPEHWRFAADLIPGHWRLRSGDTAVAGIFRREADRLESEATADDVVKKARLTLQEVAASHSCSLPPEVPDDPYRRAAQALARAGLLRGDR